MTIKKEKELQQLKRIGQIVARTLTEMKQQARPGMTTAELDELGRKQLEKYGARSAPQLVYNFPGATCISINEEVAHGIPGPRKLEPGDLINIDVSAELDGYFADTGGSFVLEPASDVKTKLCRHTQDALNRALHVARARKPLYLIGKEIERVAQEHGYHPIRNLGSHGVGRALHEEPKFIPGYFEPAEKRRLWEGLVITIEPFLSTNVDIVREADDGWTLKGPPGNLSAQFEHTIVITRDRPIVVTAL